LLRAPAMQLHILLEAADVECGAAQARATHGHGRTDQIGGEYVSVHLAALDDLPVEYLIAAPIHYMDGLHDDWQNPPAERRHL
jgi:hypothetical protein